MKKIRFTKPCSTCADGVNVEHFNAGDTRTVEDAHADRLVAKKVAEIVKEPKPAGAPPAGAPGTKSRPGAPENKGKGPKGAPPPPAGAPQGGDEVKDGEGNGAEGSDTGAGEGDVAEGGANGGA